MLKLPDEERARHDVSSLQMVVHAAAPCPVEVKRQMIEWWGPIINEYYAGSEGNGFCAIGTEQWLAHPGSVGMPMMGTIHILDEDGDELPDRRGRADLVRVASCGSSTTTTRRRPPGAYNDKGWSSLGDIGYLDDDGFLYLTDRART